jgi:hypothetical protein
MMIECYCCRRDVPLVRKVELRGDASAPPGGFSSPDDPAYLRYKNEMTYRTAFICPGCFHLLDNECGLAEISGRAFRLAGKSRGDKAPTYDEAKYREWQQRETTE